MLIENHLAWLEKNPFHKGSFIDIGAYHPTRISNTFKFYQRGSSGFAIDIGKEKESLWKRFRPRDTFINKAIVPNSFPHEKVTFLKGGTYGECTDHISGKGVINNENKVASQVETIRPQELDQLVLNSNSWKRAAWRFINIDIEGYDTDIIRDLSLEALKPDIIAIEEFTPASISASEKLDWYTSQSPTVKLLRGRDFALMSIAGPTLIFVATA